MHRSVAVLAATAVLVVGAAAPAAAQYPGENGEATYTDETTWAGAPCLDTGLEHEEGLYGYVPSGGSAWSPDGRLLALSVDGTLATGIVLVDQDECSPRLLTSERSGGMSFSPDGEQLAVSVAGVGVRVLSVATGQVLRTFPGVYDPSWDPKGGQLAVVRGGDVYLQPLGGGPPRRWKADASSPDFAPNGSKIVYLADGRPRYANVHGSSKKVWTVPVAAMGEVVWSPDGKQLLTPYISDHSFGEDCVAVTLDGQVQRVLDSSGGCTSLSWQPLPKGERKA